MNKMNTSRRAFLQTAFYSALLYGTGSLPNLIRTAHANAAPLQNRFLANLNLEGGPDFRHLVVPAFDANQNSFGYKYWSNRWRAHRIANDPNAWQTRWNDDYYPITVGGQNWNSGLADVGNLNSGITFGIWREAGWLIDMFRAGNVALVFNAVGGQNRDHALSSLQLDQGNLLSMSSDVNRSGWGGRVARSAGGNVISVTTSPTNFCFGPLGNAPNYNQNRVDNGDLVSINNLRDFGLFDATLDTNQFYRREFLLARASKSYYAALQQEATLAAFDRFLDHEQTVREFGELIQGRLDQVDVPILLQALTDGVDDESGNPINPAPGSSNSRPTILRRFSFGRQIRNLFDVIATNDLLNARVASLNFGRWDSHAGQRLVPGVLANDPNNPDADRGIEGNFRDIFGGRFGSNPVNASALHGGFSALWANLPSTSRNNLVLTIAGEFGRQIRDNGDFGTDHGRGNLMLVISESCAGGVYGEMFQEDEIDLYDDESLNTPDIEPRTEIDHLFGAVAEWVAPGSRNSVFPRLASSHTGEAPIIEIPGMFNNLFS